MSEAESEYAYAARWLMFAETDLRSAYAVLSEGIYNNACFFAQQTIEKCLKSLLALNDATIPKVHSITKLVRMVDADQRLFGDLDQELKRIDDFYIPTRYPDSLPGMLSDGLPNEQDAMGAVTVAQRVYERVMRIVNDAGNVAPVDDSEDDARE